MISIGKRTKMNYGIFPSATAADAGIVNNGATEFG